MKLPLLFSLLAVSISAFGADGCKPIHDTNPISISVVAKDGDASIMANDLHVTGNALSPKQPAEKLIFTAGALSFSLTPIATCKDGLLIEFKNSKLKKQTVIAWGKEDTIEGKTGSEYFINVTSHEEKQK